jgi:PTS system nitrogen regulatory IIA component
MIDLVLPRMRVSNKKALLEELARIAAPLAGLDPANLLSALQERERIGCTGIGHGVALPHARFGSIEKPITVFARLFRRDVSHLWRTKIPTRSPSSTSTGRPAN